MSSKRGRLTEEDVSTPLADSSISDIPAIPANALLLHIGVFKTGTTALQEALRRSPEALGPAGVLYRGPHAWHWKSLRRLLRRDGKIWAELERTIQSHDGRVMCSSENLCECSDAQAERVVASLGKGRPVHILITVRSLADMLPSAWQQFVKRGLTAPYATWLESVLSGTENSEPSYMKGHKATSFRRRNDFPRLLERWGKTVGQENVTFVVSDKRQPERLLRVTEQLLALAPRGLEFHPVGRANRSMTYTDAELLRRINSETAELLSTQEFRKLVRRGVFPSLYRSEGKGERTRADRIPLPAWAADSIGRIGREQAEILRGSAASIVGDIDEIAQSSVDSSETGAVPDQVPMEQAVAAVVGALRAAHVHLNETQT